MLTKTIELKVEHEDWKFSFTEGSTEIDVYLYGKCVGFMPKETLASLVDLKKAIDDLA